MSKGKKGANIADTWVCKNCRERNENWRVYCKNCDRKRRK